MANFDYSRLNDWVNSVHYATKYGLDKLPLQADGKSGWDIPETQIDPDDSLGETAVTEAESQGAPSSSGTPPSLNSKLPESKVKSLSIRTKGQGDKCKPGETSASTGCTTSSGDSHKKPGKEKESKEKKPKKYPKEPHFISGNKNNVKENLNAIQEMKELADKEDLEGVLNHPGTGSPKVQEFKKLLMQMMMEDMGGDKEEEKPTPPKPVSKPKPPSKPNISSQPGGFLAPPKKPAEKIPEPNLTNNELEASLENKKGALNQWLKGLADHTMEETGLSAQELKSMLQSANPANAKVAEVRAKVAGYFLTGGWGKKNAIMDLLDVYHNPSVVNSHIQNIGTGNIPKAQKEYANTPLYDLQVLAKINVHNSPVPGQANATYTRELNMGSTSVTGDYRHELGHALKWAMGGIHKDNKTAMTKAVWQEFEKAKERVKLNPAGAKNKLSHEFYEKAYGVIGKRGLDNWDENAAEHYRGYHKAVYQDKFEGGNGKNLDRYRELHPGWANIWDSWYTSALLAHHLSEL